VTIERRTFTAPVEFRAATDTARPQANGYGYVFDSLSRNLGAFVERIAPGAGQRSVEQDDIVALANHDKNLLLGRVSAGTLTVGLDTHGSPYRIDLPDTTAGRDWAISLERRDVIGSSFGFSGTTDEWEKREDGSIVRTLVDFSIRDVGPVTFPAYSATEAALRSLADHADADPADVIAAAKGGDLSPFLAPPATTVFVRHWHFGTN
jgi:HK97 family phage prohead protease